MKTRLSIMFFLLTALVRFGGAQTIIQTIQLPNTTFYNFTWGLTADSPNLFIASNTSNSTEGRKILKLNFSGVPVDSVTAPSGVVGNQGLARDGDGNYYFVRRYTAICTIMKFSPAGALVDSFRYVSSKYIGGIVWDGTHIWFSLYYPDAEVGLYKLDFTTKQIVDTIRVPTLQPYGVTWDGQYLYYVENGFQGNPRGIFRVDPDARDTVGFIPEPNDLTSNGTNPQDCAWDGRYMWLLGEPVGASSGRALYKYDLMGSGTPAINVPVRFFDLGRVRIGNTQQVTATIQNIGTANLRIDSMRILYSNRFTTDLTPPVIISPSSSSNFTISFSPVSYGVDSAHVVLYHNDPTRQPQVIRNVAMGIHPAAYINIPASYNYGTRRVNSTNPWTLRIENQGATQLRIDSVRFLTGNFFIEQGILPLMIDSVNSRTLRVWFNPTSAVSFNDSMRLFSNASNTPQASLALSGNGDATPLALGTAFWTTPIPLHPISNTFRRVRAVRAIGDISGDGKPDVIVCTDNYWTMALHGNSSGESDSLWGFSSYIASFSAGPIGSEGDFSYQKALAIASDLNGDGFNDVVIGTGGGNEHVYAINGRTGQMFWTFGTDHPDSFGLGDISGVDASTDFNNDGVPDVIAAGSATQPGGVGGRRSIYVFSGANGNLIWQAPLLGFTHAVTAIADVTGDGSPDVVGTVGEPSYKAVAFNGVTSAIIWEFPVASTTGGAKEVITLPIPGRHPDVILGAFWGPIFRINGQTGAMIWQRSTNGRDPTRLARLRDINNDGIDEIVTSLLVGDAWCLDGATGNILWTYPANSGMDITICSDLNNDGYDEVVVASQNAGIVILRGNNGQLLYQHVFGGSEQGRSVAVMADIDGNNSAEIIGGSDLSRVVLLSGGLDAPVSVGGNYGLPEQYALSNSYPNPFNPSTSFRLDVPVMSNVDIVIYDVLGRRVRTMHYERLAAGSHTLTWDGKDDGGSAIASGVYFLRLRAEGVERAKAQTFQSGLKLMLMK